MAATASTKNRILLYLRICHRRPSPIKIARWIRISGCHSRRLPAEDSLRPRRSWKSLTRQCGLVVIAGDHHRSLRRSSAGRSRTRPIHRIRTRFLLRLRLQTPAASNLHHQQTVRLADIAMTAISAAFMTGANVLFACIDIEELMLYSDLAGNTNLRCGFAGAQEWNVSSSS